MTLSQVLTPELTMAQTQFPLAVELTSWMAMSLAVRVKQQWTRQLPLEQESYRLF